MRKPIVIANWKMNKSLDEALDFAGELKAKLPHGTVAHVDIIICPAFLHIAPVALNKILPSGVALGAQDAHWEEKGAFTGCVSPVMLKDVRTRYAIIGHSERRRYFGEASPMLKGKLTMSMRAGLVPVFCVGEGLGDRQAGKTFQALDEQMAVLGDISREFLSDPSEFILAYEPVWAIGTGHNATAEQAQEVHVHLRELLTSYWGSDQAQATRIVYGGSIAPDNFASIMACGDVDGGLVGGASLDCEKFLKLIEIARGGENGK
ncbi:MAG: triose-phosphate isomerase [Elusimicrobia bacterium]|nr:triose-phosphate isomerase [Elusimicrobiota bacterium]